MGLSYPSVLQNQPVQCFLLSTVLGKLFDKMFTMPLACRFGSWVEQTSININAIFFTLEVGGIRNVGQGSEVGGGGFVEYAQFIYLVCSQDGYF